MTPIRQAGSNGCHRFYSRQDVFVSRSRTRASLTDSCTWVRRDNRQPRQEEEHQFYCRCRSGRMPANSRLWESCGGGGVMSCPKHWPDLKLSLKKDFRAVFTCRDRLINHILSDVLLSDLVSPHNTMDYRLTPLK